MSLTVLEKMELETLLKRQGLYLLPADVNPNYEFLFTSLKNQKYDLRDQLLNGYRGVILEGSSRSGKTYSSIEFIVYLCLFVEKNCTINVYRETFEEFKTTLYQDFSAILDYYDLPNKFKNAERIKSFKIGSNTINFIGCDKVSKAHGAGCDYAFFNEMIHIPKEIFDHVEMRCRKFWWGDYNPSLTEHYIFHNILTRDDVGYKQTTFLDNHHLSRQERIKILSTEPWESGTYKVKNNKIWYKGLEVSEKNQPPPHIKNIEAGTADEFWWKVYGLGLRGSMKGQVFGNVTWLDEFPEELMSIAIYPNDFGFTVDPHVCNRYAETESSIFIEPLTYMPIDTAEYLDEVLQSVGVKKIDIMPSDSSDKYMSEKNGTVEMVQDLEDLGYVNVFKISKTHSVMHWLNSMKKKKIHIVRNKYYKQAKTEQEQYRMREINGIAINQPIDKYNHIWDSARYGHIAWNNPERVYKTNIKDFNSLGIGY